MSGIVTELSELIKLKQYAQMVYQPQKSRAQLMGNHQSTMRGRGMDFDEVRSYQAGDDVRHMEWRVTARTGKPHIKLYREERERPIIIMVDFNPSMYFATQVALKSVVASRLAALLAWTASKHGDRVGGLLYSNKRHIELKPRGRQLGVLPLLNALNDFSHELPQSDDAQPMSAALMRLRRVALPGSLVILMSDFNNFDEDSQRHLARMSQHLDIMAFNFKDIIELKTPKPGCYSVTDGDSEVVVDTRSQVIRQQYRRHFRRKQRQLEDFCQQYAIPLTTVLPTDDIVTLAQLCYAGQARRQYG